jgi:carbon-monoxide dehydrogenase large subunit
MDASPMLRREDLRFVTGHGRYLDDITLPRQAWLHLVLSPHAHARILGIDSSAALAIPGVLAVLTGSDVAADGLGPLPADFGPEDFHGGEKSFRAERHVLARDTVRHVGDRVACVIATSPELARDAAERVAVEYEILPAAIDSLASLEADAPLVWPEHGTNRSFRFALGDASAVEAAFARAARTVRVELVNNRIMANPIEQRGTIGSFEAGTQTYRLISSTQCPHRIRGQLAKAILKVPMARVVVEAPDVGGAFGVKVAIFPEDVLVLWASRKVGRPVKWVPSRSETFLTDDHARDQLGHSEMALDEAGRILAVRGRMVWNLGAYLASTGAVMPVFGPPMITGVYDVPAAHVEVLGVYTNTQPTAAYRGAGRPEGAFFIERLMDEAAHATGLGQDEIRRRNFIRPAQMPYRTVLGLTYDSGSFAAVLDKAQALSGWTGFPARRSAAQARGMLRGLGLAYYIETAAFFNERMEIRFDPDGAVTIMAGTVSSGQGHETVFPRMVSEWLHVPFEDVSMIQGDTQRIAYGRGTFGSRSMVAGGNALRLAADEIVEKGRVLAAILLDADPAALDFSEGAFRDRGTNRFVSLPEIAQQSFSSIGPLAGHGPGLWAVGLHAADAYTFPNGCTICEVEIDPRTGQTRIVRLTAIDDVGTIVDHVLLEGQLMGGLAQGIGQALSEAVRFDQDSGQLLSGSFMDYGLPRASDLPDFQVEAHAVPCTTNRLGVKGAGEAGCISAPPAVMHAVLDALRPLGVSEMHMPATPAAIWQAIRSANRRQGAEA